jgi:hypothetical protein
MSLLGVTFAAGQTIASTKPKAVQQNGTLATHFQNPIMDNGADPWVTYYKGNYYMTMTTGDNVTIWM